MDHAWAYRIYNFVGFDLWLYQRPLPCSGSSRAPVLTSTEPYLGHPAFELELIGARAVSVCLFGLSAGRQDQLIGTCTLHLQNPVFPLVALSNKAGFAKSPTFVLPLDSRLRGLTYYAQAFVADPQGSALGVTFSAGLKLVLGD